MSWEPGSLQGTRISFVLIHPKLSNSDFPFVLVCYYDFEGPNTFNLFIPGFPTLNTLALSSCSFRTVTHPSWSRGPPFLGRCCWPRDVLSALQTSLRHVPPSMGRISFTHLSVGSPARSETHKHNALPPSHLQPNFGSLASPFPFIERFHHHSFWERPTTCDPLPEESLRLRFEKSFYLLRPISPPMRPEMEVPHCQWITRL